MTLINHGVRFEILPHHDVARAVRDVCEELPDWPWIAVTVLDSNGNPEDVSRILTQPARMKPGTYVFHRDELLAIDLNEDAAFPGFDEFLWLREHTTWQEGNLGLYSVDSPSAQRLEELGEWLASRGAGAVLETGVGLRLVTRAPR